MSRKLSLGLGPLLLLLAFAAGCRNAGGGSNNPTPRQDAGTTAQTCMSSADCGGASCVGGICQVRTACVEEADCTDPSQPHCLQGSFFCAECDPRRADTCPANQRCQPNTLECAPIDTPDSGVAVQCSGTCTDRDDCGPDQVCSQAGECCPPPSRCRSPLDCPASQPECNGASGQCFGGSGCFQDADCETEAACTGGRCFCDIQGAPPGTCRQRPDECQADADCFVNGAFAAKFCTVANPPKRCADAPSCTRDADCASFGLVCDTMAGSPSMGYCQNGQACTAGGGECPQGRVCQNNVCVAQTCFNTPSLCGPNETCDPVTAMCVPNNTGTCTQDSECQAGYYCDTSSSTCRVGCRDNSECPGGICNASHQCEFPMGQFCGPCATDTDCPGGGRCVDVLGTGGKCYEQCSSLLMQPCSDPNDACIFGNCSCL